MEKKIIFSIVFLFCISCASAISTLNVYIDDNGETLILGEGDENIILPEGVNIEDGEIYGKTSEFSTKEGDVWTFNLSISDSEITIYLPENIIIKEIENGKVYSVGNSLIIVVEDSFYIKYSIEKGNNFYLVVIIILLCIITLYFIYKKMAKNRSKIEIIKQVLNEREKLIVNNLKKSGKIKSNYLRKICDMPKASFSRHIKELEKKNIIKKSGEGKNKFIQLNRGFY